MARRVGKPGQKRRGRSSLYDEKLIARILANIRKGCFLHVAHEAEGIASSTFNEWRRRDPSFAAEVEKAIAHARQKAEAEVYKADPRFWLRNGPGKTRKGKDGWTDAQTVEHTGQDGGPLRVVIDWHDEWFAEEEGERARDGD